MISFLRHIHYSIVLLITACSASIATTASFNANYDDLKQGALAGPAPGIGTYNDLMYNSWLVDDNNEAVAGGFTPHTTPNTILTVESVQMTNGTPSITVAPPYTSVKFSSFYFGCGVETEQGIVDEATQCTITVAGFKKGSNQEVAVASFTFTPPTKLVGEVPMTQAVLPDSFGWVYNITIISDSPATQALGIDNLVYTVSK